MPLMPEFAFTHPPTDESEIPVAPEACHYYESSECATARQQNRGNLPPNHEGTSAMHQPPF